MSAFIVNDYHVARLIQYASRQDVKYYAGKVWLSIKGNEQAIFGKLITANMESVNERYRENEPPMPGKYAPDYERTFSAVQIIKGCHCFTYQACETEDWETSEAKAIIDAIESHAVRQVPGYEAAEWEIEPREINKKIVRLI